MDKAYSIDVKKDKNSQIVLVSGELIINYIDEIKQQLLDLIDYSKNVNFKVTNPSSMDVTFIQIIFALKTAYNNKGLEFNFEGVLNEEVFALISNAGFDDLFKI